MLRPRGMGAPRWEPPAAPSRKVGSFGHFWAKNHRSLTWTEFHGAGSAKVDPQEASVKLGGDAPKLAQSLADCRLCIDSSVNMNAFSLSGRRAQEFLQEEEEEEEEEAAQLQSST